MLKRKAGFLSIPKTCAGKRFALNKKQALIIKRIPQKNVFLTTRIRGYLRADNFFDTIE